MDTDTIRSIMSISISIAILIVVMFAIFIFREYYKIKKETAGEGLDSLKYFVRYIGFMLFVIFLAYMAGTAREEGHKRLAYIFAQQLGLFSNLGLLCFALAIREFVKSFPGKDVEKYSRLMIIIFLVALVSQFVQAILVFFVEKLPDIVEYSTQFVIWSAIFLVFVIMIKLRSLTKGSVLAKVLTFLIIGFALQFGPGVVSVEIIEYQIENVGPGENAPFIISMIGFINVMLMMFAYYFLYRGIKEITLFFKGFGENANR